MIEHAGNLMQGVPRHSNIAERIHNATDAIIIIVKKIRHAVEKEKK